MSAIGNDKLAVVTGNPVDGITLYGPFDSGDQAHEWASTELPGLEWWITDLNKPHMDRGRIK